MFLLLFDRFGTKSPRKEYLHIVGGNCDWDPDGPYDQRQIFGTLRLGDWKIIIGNIGKDAYFIIFNVYCQHLDHYYAEYLYLIEIFYRPHSNKLI